MAITSRGGRWLTFHMTFLIGVLAAGCSSSSSSLPRFSGSPQLVQEPALGEERTAEVGDTLVNTARLVKIPAIYVLEPITERTKRNPHEILLPAGTFRARYQNERETCYVPPKPVMVDSDDETSDDEMVVCVSPTGDAKVVTTHDAASLFPLSRPIRFERTTVIDLNAPSFEQELLYNGRAGNVVKFLYREFINKNARPAFTQDVQYDLNEGKTVGFKSARIEIIDATNLSITYRVLAHFPPPPM